MDIEADKREAMVFAASLVEQVNRQDVANMVQVQRGMLQRFEKTNEMLINFNQLSFTRYEASVQDFQRHTQILYEMKKDLDSIFKRIRSLKQKLSKTYPEAFTACSSVIMMEDDDEDDLPPPYQPVPATVDATKAASSQTALPKSSGFGEQQNKVTAASSHPSHPKPQKSRSTSQSIQHSRDNDKFAPVRRTSAPKPEHRSLSGARPQLSHSSSSASSSSSGQSNSKVNSSSVLASSRKSTPGSLSSPGHSKPSASASIAGSHSKTVAGGPHAHSHARPKPKPSQAF